MKLTIHGPMITLNQYVQAERGRGWYKAAKIKKEETERVFLECRAQKLTYRSKPVKMRYHWFVKSLTQDPDNITFSKKFIHDGLVLAGILEDDSLKFIKEFLGDKFTIDKENQRVEIEII